MEVLDSLDISCRKLAILLRKHKGRIVIYTGAGISTSANIPDYRGTNGLWTNGGDCMRDDPNTLLNMQNPENRITNKVKSTNCPRLRLPEATFAQPTYTHMAITSLVRHNYVRHVVSQNVDGLHLRSGLPSENLSELHGNLFIEQCESCSRILFRAFDVAEGTARGNHLTGRICPYCRSLSPDQLDALDKQFTAEIEHHNRTTSPAECARRRRCIAKKLACHFRKGKLQLPGTLPEGAVCLPLLRDVVVHFRERQAIAGLAEVYRVESALRAIYGGELVDEMNRLASIRPPRGRRPASIRPSDTKGNLWRKKLRSILDKRPTIAGEFEIDGPSTLIFILGSSLSILKHYSFLWPLGLGKCIYKMEKRVEAILTNDKATTEVEEHSISQHEGCCLAILNLQPTCKDGLADVLCRFPCDLVLREVMQKHLNLPVDSYFPSRDDQISKWATPLDANEELTRIRPNFITACT